MARRLALFALMACAVIAHQPGPRPRPRPRPYDSDVSASESFDPFSSFEEYDYSYETTKKPKVTKSQSTKPPKAINKNTGTKVNNTIKFSNNKKDDKKNSVKTTTINIESHTNFLVTKRPEVVNSGGPVYPLGIVPQQLPLYWQDPSLVRYPPRPIYMQQLPPATLPISRRPTSRRPPLKRVTSTTKRPTTTKRRTTTRRRVTTTARPIKYTTTKSFKKPFPSKNSALSEYFQDNKLKKSPPKKPVKITWFQGMVKKMYNIFWAPSTWFMNLFEDDEPKGTTTTTTTTTTAAPPMASTTLNWFQSLLNSEEDDSSAPNDSGFTKKSTKKALKRNYKGFQLLRAYPDAQWKIHEMLELQEEAQGSGMMWWTAPSINGSTDVLVPPDLLADVKEHFHDNKIDFDVVIWDLQKAIIYENPRLSKKQRIELEQLRGHPMTWRRYHRYADILRYLEYLQHSYSEFVELVPLGRTSEGLPLVAVKVSLPDNYTKDANTKDNNKKWKLRSRMKPAVWIEGGAHAREWIAPAVATWMLNALTEGEKGKGDSDVLKQTDIYIMPVLNPDGYEHSHTHDRLWKKTRSRPSDQANDYFQSWFPWNWGKTECVGVDADRNWDYHWGEQDSSKDPCADNYAGSHPFSEPETRAVSEFLAERRGQIKVYISLHAYSQSWLIPSSHAHAPFADDGVLMEMGKLATVALADLYGTKYQVGTAGDIRQPASGMSHDWAKARAGIKYAYHVDLRDAVGPYGFLLPGSQIVSTARETWQAVKAIVDNL